MAMPVTGPATRRHLQASADEEGAAQPCQLVQRELQSDGEQQQQGPGLGQVVELRALVGDQSATVEAQHGADDDIAHQHREARAFAGDPRGQPGQQHDEQIENEFGDDGGVHALENSLLR